MQFFLFGGGGRHGDKAQKSIVCVFYFVDMHFTKWTCNGVICRSLSLQQRKEEEAPFYLSLGGKKRKETHLVFFPHIKSFVLGVCCSFFAIDWLAHMKQPRKADAPPPRPPPPRFLLTCLDGVLEGGAAADQDVVQGAGLVLQLPVVHLQQLAGVVEVDHFGVAIERLHDVGQQDVHHLLQEAQSLGVAVHGREEVWGTKKREGFFFFFFTSLSFLGG